MNIQSVAILTGPDTYLDHVGVLCALMDIPLIVTEEQTYISAQTFYPQINATQRNLSDLSLEFLASHFDVIFESGKFWKAQIDPLLKVLHKKSMRFVFCPHGNSDKGRNSKNHVEQDISLVYGEQMINLLTQTGAIQKIKSLIKTGNYRLTFYKQHKSFYDNIVKEKISSKLDLSKKTILYAPTWEDGENPTSFFQETQKLINQLGQSYNIIVKLHPFLEQFHPAQTYYARAQYENHSQILFLENFPMIYPLLQICDLYIGDYSSIGYDFLAFNKPLYFLTQASDSHETNELHPCGIVIPSTDQTLAFIENSWEENLIKKADLRKKTYDYAFGEEKPISLVKQEILQIIKNDKTSPS